MDVKNRIDVSTQREEIAPSTVAEHADYIVDYSNVDLRVLLAAHMNIGVTRFAFGLEELQHWEPEELSQSLSPSICRLLVKLKPYRLENLDIRYRGGNGRTVATWILNQDSVCFLLDDIPSWPSDGHHRRLGWYFFRSRPISYPSQSRSLVLLQPTQGDVSVFEGLGMRCSPRSSVPRDSASHRLPEVYTEAPPSGTWSGWDERDASAYFNHPPPRWSPAFPRIREWWKASHDGILARQIDKEQWSWSPDYRELVKNTPSGVIEKFKAQKDDPHVWYNVIVSFARWRAVELGLHKTVKVWPVWRKCAVCGRFFHESSARVEKLGLNQIDVCTPCLKPWVFGKSSSMSKEDVIEYLRTLSQLIERVPESDFGKRRDILLGLSTPARVAVLRLLAKRPSLEAVEGLFGSWFNALVESGVLQDGARQGVFGTECIARDGHRCLSLAEKTIDDFLTSEGIAHKKEVPYPEGGYRADFAVQDILIEYFGLQTRESYALKTRSKIEICRSSGVHLIEIYPADLIGTAKLRRKLRPVLPKR